MILVSNSMFKDEIYQPPNEYTVLLVIKVELNPPPHIEKPLSVHFKYETDSEQEQDITEKTLTP